VIDKGVAALDLSKALVSFAEFEEKYSSIVGK
jgi:hypothetical protein